MLDSLGLTDLFLRYWRFRNISALLEVNLLRVRDGSTKRRGECATITKPGNAMDRTGTFMD